MNENEYYEEEGRYYANPQLGLDETSQFLESFEAARQRENDRIAQETHALGTDVPSSMGGLSGSGGVWRQRYQNPQVAKMITDLDAEMQGQALSTALSNDLGKWQERYNQAKRAYNKRQKKSNTTNPTGDPDKPDNLNENPTTLELSKTLTEGLSKKQYMDAFLKYMKEGMTTEEAEAKAKADVGV